MSSLARYVVALVVSVCVFLVVLGGLLWSRDLALREFERRSAEFLIPSKHHVAGAQRSLDQLLIALYSKAHPSEPAVRVPFRFQVTSVLGAVEDHLTELVRLEQAFGDKDSFNLPSRARRQLGVVRQRLSEARDDAPPPAAAIFATLSPLRSTLAQLERIYELGHRDSLREERAKVTTAARLIAIAVAILVLVAVPLICGLGLRLRDALRREARFRVDLEEAKKNLEAMVLYDDLTGLGNRHLLKARLEQAAGQAKRASHCSAVMYIDLDHFKRINDSLGHDIGDEVLKAIGARLKESLRSGDTVARIGGDEFTVIVTELDGGDAAGPIAAKLLRRINEPVMVGGHELVVSASIGVTVMPDDGDDPGVLMKHADMALYKAKELGRDNIQFFVEEMNRKVLEHMAVERALRMALREDDLALHYQPLVSLQTDTVVGVEALLRWPQEDGTMIAPDRFIPVAETSGLMLEMGYWVFRRACRDLATLRERGNPDLRMSVNLSARQFRDSTLLTRIETALSAQGLPPSALELEITETTLIDDIDLAVGTLRALRVLGVTVAIDDFGIGHSSLNHLKHLPLDVLKIDRSFIRDVETDKGDRSIIEAILAMARSLSLHVVAEGIETEGQLHFLTERDCELGQGYLFARPVALESLWIGDAIGGSEPRQGTPGGLHLV